MQLVVDKIARSFGINEIFKDISFMIDKGEKNWACRRKWQRQNNAAALSFGSGNG